MGSTLLLALLLAVAVVGPTRSEVAARSMVRVAGFQPGVCGKYYLAQGKVCQGVRPPG